MPKAIFLFVYECAPILVALPLINPDVDSPKIGEARSNLYFFAIKLADRVDWASGKSEHAYWR